MSQTQTRPTFANRLAKSQGVEESEFAGHMLGRCLHAPLRWIYPFAKVTLTDYLEADIGCTRAISRMRSNREAYAELTEFSYHPRNRSLLRRVFKQRLSTQRSHKFLRQLSRSVSESED